MTTIDKLHQPHPMPFDAAAALAAQCTKDEVDGWTYRAVPYPTGEENGHRLYVVDVRDETGFFVGTL